MKNTLLRYAIVLLWLIVGRVAFVNQAEANEGYGGLLVGTYIPISAASDVSQFTFGDIQANVGYEIFDFFAPEFNLEYIHVKGKDDFGSSSVFTLTVGPRLSLHFDFFDLYGSFGFGYLRFDQANLSTVQVGAGMIYKINDWVAIGPYFRFYHGFNGGYETTAEDTSEVYLALAGGGDPEWVNIGAALQISLASIVDRRRYQAPTHPGAGR